MIRSKALKALKRICDVDASLLGDGRVKEKGQVGVGARGLDLLGSYVVGDAAFIGVYLDNLRERVHDSSPAVRKRVTRIFRAICLKAPACAQYRAICLCLFSKMKERNEGIGKLVVGVLAVLCLRKQGRVAVQFEPKAQGQRVSRPLAFGIEIGIGIRSLE